MNLKLRNLRLETGLTQKELAKILNSTDKSIWSYEKGIATPPYDILAAYANYFGVTVDYLIGRTDDFETPTAAPRGDTLQYSEEEKKLIEDYRVLNTASKKLVKQTLETLRATTAQSEQKKYTN